MVLIERKFYLRSFSNYPSSSHNVYFPNFSSIQQRQYPYLFPTFWKRKKRGGERRKRWRKQGGGRRRKKEDDEWRKYDGGGKREEEEEES